MWSCSWGLTNDITVLMGRGTRDGVLSPRMHEKKRAGGHTARWWPPTKWEESSQSGTKVMGTLILGFSVFRTVKNKCLLFIFLYHPELTKIDLYFVLFYVFVMVYRFHKKDGSFLILLYHPGIAVCISLYNWIMSWKTYCQR